MKQPEEIPVKISLYTGKPPCQGIIDYGEEFKENPKGYPGYEALLTGLVEKHFREACRRMMPLLEPVLINSIIIRVSVSTPSTDTLATYDYGKSDAAAGKYVFTVTTRLLLEYLFVHFYDVCPLGSREQYVWEHELIHMLDHEYITELNYNIERPDMTEVLVDFILSFRGEGMAEIFYFMNNHSEYRSIKAARTQFLKRIDFLANRPWNLPGFAGRMYRIMRWEYKFYSVGTWMILHVLGSEGYPKRTPEAAVVAEKIKKRQAMSDEEILSIVRQALEIDNRSFILGLTTPGPDGKPFIKHEDLEDLARYVELCKADMERNWSKPAQLRGDPKIVALFRLLRPKRPFPSPPPSRGGS